MATDSARARCAGYSTSLARIRGRCSQFFVYLSFTPCGFCKCRFAGAIDAQAGSGEHAGVNGPISPWVVGGRIVSIIGMSFAAAVGILGLVGPIWSWAIVGGILFWPFFGLIVFVERVSTKKGWIGPEAHATMYSEPPD